MRLAAKIWHDEPQEDKKNIHVVCAEHPSSGIWYSTVADRFTTVLMKTEGRLSFTCSSCPLFRRIPLSKHSTSPKHSSLRGHDPVWSDLRLKLGHQTGRQLSKGVFRATHSRALLPPPLRGCCSSCGCTAETDTATDPAGNQPSPKERFLSSQVSSLIRPKHGKVSTCASITDAGRRGYTASILGEDRTASAYTDWWSIPSEAAFPFSTQRAGCFFILSQTWNLNFWENPLSLQQKFLLI